MTKSPFFGLLVAVAAGCGTSTTDATTAATDTTATDTTAVTDDGTAGSTLSDAPDPAGKCDAAAIRELVSTAYAKRAAAAAAATDTTATTDTTTPPPRGDRKGAQLVQLGFVYDADDSGTLDDTELAALESDFTAGCAAFAAKLLATFDANADGTLDATELAAARAQAEANRPAPPAGARPPRDGQPPPDGACPNGPPPDGARPPRDGARPNGPPPDGAQPPPAAHDPLDHLVKLYDANEDGTLDADELASLRADVRARIVAGEPPLPRPPPPADATTATDTGN